MGLGKTVQIITLLSTLNKDQGARPFLVAVPNSTLGNCETFPFETSFDTYCWLTKFRLFLFVGIREFARWAPELRVVPYGVCGMIYVANSGLANLFRWYRVMRNLVKSLSSMSSLTPLEKC